MLISQEQFLSFYADKLGVNREDLGDENIRLAYAFYHAFYLPGTALIENRANELDLKWRYDALGFQADVPTISVGTIRVRIAQNATTELRIRHPFRVQQDGKIFVASQDLVIAPGTNEATFTVTAQEEGRNGTPSLDSASINIAASWLIGASIVFVSITPGEDGLSDEEIQGRFRSFAFQPVALVRGVDHEDAVEREFDYVTRAIARERTRVVFSGGTYSETLNITGYLSIGVINQGGDQSTQAELDEIKEKILRLSVPYGRDRLNIYPLLVQEIFATMTVRREPGVPVDAVRENIIAALDVYLNWESWEGDIIYTGDLWAVVKNVAGVEQINKLRISGRDSQGRPSDTEFYLRPWQLPGNGVTTDSITVLEYDGTAIL